MMGIIPSGNEVPNYHHDGNEARHEISSNTEKER